MENLQEIKNKIQKNDLTTEQVYELIKDLDAFDMMTLSKEVGYLALFKKCMGKLYKKFIPIFCGAVVFVRNEKGQVLLQHRSDNDLWGILGGFQEVGESFAQNAIREAYEESGLIIKEEDLILLDVVSGESRRHLYNGDEVSYINAAVFVANKYEGEPRVDSESKELRFFDIDNLPKNLYDVDLFEVLLKNVDKF